MVKRIDARDVKRGKRQAEIDRQDKCFGYWEAGRRKEAVAMAANGKVTYAAVFDYFKRELGAIGVKSVAKFRLSITERRPKAATASCQSSEIGIAHYVEEELVAETLTVPIHWVVGE